MANTTLTQTGAEVQADLNKVEGLANIKTIGSGLSLSNAGELSTSGGGGSGIIVIDLLANNLITAYYGNSLFVINRNTLATIFANVDDIIYGASSYYFSKSGSATIFKGFNSGSFIACETAEMRSYGVTISSAYLFIIPVGNKYFGYTQIYGELTTEPQ